MIEFQGWRKIARLFRDCVITEKIDGTNGAIGIKEHQIDSSCDGDCLNLNSVIAEVGGAGYLVYAQSRNRIITPQDDNHGFARWVQDNAEALVNILGPGLHFGEWWGSGINRGYGLPKGEHRFSLFNTKRWNDQTLCDAIRLNVPELSVVPVLYQGLFSTETVIDIKDGLCHYGSAAAPGFTNPEGVVVYHTAGNVMFKSTLENDWAPKAETAKRDAGLAT
jgi:hypothetical protein